MVEPAENLADTRGGGRNLQGAWEVPSIGSVCHTKEKTGDTFLVYLRWSWDLFFFKINLPLSQKIIALFLPVIPGGP